MNYADAVFDEIRVRGWSVGTFSFWTADGRRMFSADAHRDDGRRYIARAGTLAVALLELQRMTEATAAAQS